MGGSFINGIWRAWSKIREGLFYSRYEGEEEFFRQPIIWNPRITMANGQMIGERSKLSWGPFAAGPTSSFCNGAISLGNYILNKIGS